MQRAEITHVVRLFVVIHFWVVDWEEISMKNSRNKVGNLKKKDITGKVSISLAALIRFVFYTDLRLDPAIYKMHTKCDKFWSVRFWFSVIRIVWFFELFIACFGRSNYTNNSQMSVTLNKL